MHLRSVILRMTSRRNGYVAAVVGAVIGLAVRLGLSVTFGDQTFFILYVPVVLVAAGLGGRGPALLATVLCLGINAATLRDALWLDPENLVDAFAFALLGPFIALVGERLWRDSREAATRQAHLQSILETVPEA
ncbi:MAG: DUF4118 domain-containing protein, partial [Phenylobacterium sp.]|nr:DUF4118 domain-containing protein [Phenylobacterium sp.]